jgi:signal transduction histidine kinase
MSRWFRQRPVAQAVAVFSALNLLMLLLFVLLVPTRPATLPLLVPLSSTYETLLRCAIAALVYLLVLWALRPGRRRPWEFGLLGLVGLALMALLTHFYLPFLGLGLIPVLARYWLSLPWVLGLVAGLVGYSAWWSLQQPLQLTLEVSFNFLPPDAANWSALALPDYPNLETSFFVFITLLFAGYSLFGLEMLVREARARQALESARQELALASREAGILFERQRLAREIHDTLAQDFASIVMHLEAAEASADPAHHQQAKTTARDGLAEARSLVWALRPDLLQGKSLEEALNQMLDQWRSKSGVSCELVVSGQPQPLHPEVELSVLRIAREALANVRKHAQARRVVVTLSYIGSEVLIDVQDDGLGFERTQIGQESYGLRLMEERVAALGGRLSFESEQGQGTTVAVALPILPTTPKLELS